MSLRMRIGHNYRQVKGFPGGSYGKESACNAGNPGSIPGSGRKIPWSREWLSTPVFLPGELHRQRRLVGDSPWSHKESDTTDRLTLLPLEIREDEKL